TRVLFHSAASAEPYHARVRRIATESRPQRLGTWEATDFPLPRPVVAPLGPCVALSRRYHDTVSGRIATSLLIQCRDTRDILGYYPPVFYVRHGWSLDTSEPLDCEAEGLQIHGMHYEFTA